MNYIRVKVKPHSARETVEILKDNRILLNVREKAENNKANERARDLLAAHLGLRPTELTLVRGHLTQNKTFRITHRDKS